MQMFPYTWELGGLTTRRLPPEGFLKDGLQEGGSKAGRSVTQVNMEAGPTNGCVK